LTKAVKKTYDPYHELSKTLNRIPNGFAPTEDGTHLKLLQWIFEPDEAELASKLKLSGETVEKMSKRLKIPLEKLKEKLKVMKEKGQIHIRRSKGQRKYGLLPFVVGIYEEQIHRMDPKFAQLFEDYVQKTQGKILFSSTPSIQRVVPVNRVIKTELEIHTLNEAENMVRAARSWGIRDCICKLQQEMIGDYCCDFPSNVCMTFSSRENAYVNSIRTKPITMERSLEILKEAEEAGLIHTSMNIDIGHKYICNCATCHCGVLRGLTEFNQPHAFVKSEYEISINEEDCIGCGKCISRCQFNALEIVDKKCVANNKCVGCGVCAIVCSKDALSLIPRNVTEISPRPKNLLRWMFKRAFSRKVNLFKLL
jgi:NAD-dependent dihydropyrimidine dehydrogenase PreA subunit